MSLATVKDNKPWVCEVHFAYDDELNLYFISDQSTRHSQEIRENKYVSGNIVIQHQEGEKPSGVYFEGVAQQLEDVADDDIARTAYATRYPNYPFWQDVGSTGSRRIYKIKVTDFYVFDVRGNFEKPGKQHMSW